MSRSREVDGEVNNFNGKVAYDGVGDNDVDVDGDIDDDDDDDDDDDIGAI
jgi:hypothetical protein